MIRTDGAPTIAWADPPKEVIRAKTKKRCSRRVDREEDFPLGPLSDGVYGGPRMYQR